MHSQSEPEVLIVGAGPTGLALACELAKHHIPLRIIEQKSQPSTHSKAFGIHARTLEWLDQSGLAEEFLRQGHKIYQAQLRISEQERFFLSFAELDSKYPFLLLLPQQQIEQILYRHLRSMGVEVEWDSRFLACRDEETQVFSMIEKSDGKLEEVNSRFLIGCDGAHSAVRESAGLRFKGTTDSNFWLLTDCQIEWQTEKEKDQLYVFNNGKGLSAYFPVTEQWGRLMFEIKDQDVPAEPPSIKEIAALARYRGLGVDHLKNPRWTSYFRFSYKLAEKYRQKHVILAGDAAHIHSPLGALGLNTGIQDAANLAWKLAYFLRNKVDEEVLDSYELERRPVGAKIVKSVQHLTHLLQSGNPFVRFFRRFLSTTVFDTKKLRHQAMNTLTQLNLEYKESYLSREFWIDGKGDASQAKIKAGEHIEDYNLTSVLEKEHLSLYELLKSPSFTLLLLAGKKLDGEAFTTIEQFYKEYYQRYSWVNIHLILPESSSDALKGTPKGLHFSAYEDAKNRLHDTFGVTAPALILVRPDGYICYRSSPVHFKHFSRYMEEQFLIAG